MDVGSEADVDGHECVNIVLAVELEGWTSDFSNECGGGVHQEYEPDEKDQEHALSP